VIGAEEILFLVAMVDPLFERRTEGRRKKEGQLTVGVGFGISVAGRCAHLTFTSSFTFKDIITVRVTQKIPVGKGQSVKDEQIDGN
jgi:hypothetical protein